MGDPFTNPQDRDAARARDRLNEFRHQCLRDCACYVRELAADVALGLRFGAHAPRCPMFRPSLDPVDRQHDAEERAYHLGQPHEPLQLAIGFTEPLQVREAAHPRRQGTQLEML